MRRPLISLLCLALAAPLVAIAADPEPVAAPETSAPESTVTTPEPPPPAKPKPVPKPHVNSKPAAAPTPAPAPLKPAEKPPAAEAAAGHTSNNGANQPVVAPAPPAVTPPAPATADVGSPAATGRSIGCLALSFAMLILGFVAGFVGRHLLSRHKLGGMTVRIGTWRGIP